MYMYFINYYYYFYYFINLIFQSMRLKQFLLTLVAMLSFVISGFAQTTVSSEADLKSILTSATGGNVVLGGNIETTSEISIPKGAAVTLDLNGHSITGTHTGILIKVNGSLVINDSQGTGVITGKSYVLHSAGGSSITLNAGKIYRASSWAVYTTGVFTVNGGSVETPDGSAAIRVAGSGSVNLEGGTVTSVQVTSGALNITDSDATVTNGVTIEDGAKEVNISSGTIKGEVNVETGAEEKITISGGAFSDDVSDYLDGNKAVIKNEDGSYEVVAGLIKIADKYYGTVKDALDAVGNGQTIEILEAAAGDESKTEIDFTKHINFTITGKAPNHALPVITFQNATVNIKDAHILIPELDARQNATINVINSKVDDAGGNSIAKSYYNGTINIDETSTVYMMQVTTMGYINVKGTLNATWQTNVYGNGMITVTDDATFNTAALHITGKDYSGRDNTDAGRVGKPALVVVDKANFNVGKVLSNNGADYSYNSSKGINIGTIEGKKGVLDIKNGAKVNIYMANGETANIGADGTVNVNASTFNVACRAAGGTATLANAGTVYTTGEANLAVAVTGAGWFYMNGVTLDADTKLDGAKVAFINGTNDIVGSTIENGFFNVGVGKNNDAVTAATFAKTNSITLGDVTVNVSEATIGAEGAAYAGWVGSAYSADKTQKKYALNIKNSLATFGYLHISKDGALNVNGHSTNKYTNDNANVDFYAGEFIINGTATFDGTDAWAKYTKMSVDHADAVLNISNGTDYEASIHNGSTTGTALKFWKAGKVKVDNTSVVEIDNQTVLVEGAELNIAGAVTAKGTVSGAGSITLGAETAKLTTATTGLSVNTSLEERIVKYVDGAYQVTTITATVGGVSYETLQEAINAATNGAVITLTADCAENVTVTQAEGVKFTIDGANHTMTGAITVDGKSAVYATAGITIKNVKFYASAITTDACINLGVSGNSNTRYTSNVTVDSCTFTGGNKEKVAVKSYTGGDKNLTITNCTVDSTMHSLLQASGIDGVTIDKCTVNSKNGINLNSSENVTISNSEIAVSGYAVRAGAGSEGGSGKIELTNNTLKTDNTEGDAVVVIRGNASEQIDLTMTQNVVSGTTHISGTTASTSISADANYWDGKDAPVVSDGATAVTVNSYYSDVDRSTLVRNPKGSIYAYTWANKITGDVTTNAAYSIKIEVLGADNTVIGTVECEKSEYMIGTSNTLTWRINFGDDDSDSWKMTWNEGAPSVNNMPTSVKLYVDGVEKATSNIKLMQNGDGQNSVLGAVSNAEGIIKSMIVCEGYNYTNADAALKAAVAAAETGDEITIIKAGTYKLPGFAGKNLTITGNVDGVVFDNIGAFNMGGVSVTFNKVTFDYYPNANYTGLQHANTMVYNNCIFNGQVFLYGVSETFNNCTFNQESSDAYNVWTYGAKAVAFNGCTFESAGKSVLIYSEQTDLVNNVTVTNSTFNASKTVEGKAAIEMDASLTAGINLTIDTNTTATGFADGSVSGNSLWNNKKGNADAANNDITVVVGGEKVLCPVYEAKIGEVKYRTIEEAFAAAVEGETITLVDDVTPELTSQRAITKAAVIDLNGKTMTLTEDDLYWGTTTFKNGNIVVDPSVVASTAVFWMFENKTLTLDSVKLTATGVTGTYLIGINGGTGSAVKLINGSEIVIGNETQADLSAVIADNGTGNSVEIEGSTINVKNIKGRFYLGGTNGDVVVDNTTATLNGVKEGFYLRAGQSLAINGTSNVSVTLNDTNGRYGINLTDITANYTKAETATVDATLFEKCDAKIGSDKYATLVDAIAAAQEGQTIVLNRDVTMDYGAREAFANNGATVTIDGNGHTLTLNQTNSDWSSFGLANNTTVIFNNMTIEKTGYGDTNGAWNKHAIIFSTPVEMNNVTVNNSMAVQAGATLKNVTINEANGYYGLWINGNGQTVTVEGGSITATNGGRGIKIADQYIDAPAQVNLTVNGMTFSTAKKAAVLVTSTAGAKITASNVNIENVAEDKTNFVWVDEDRAANYAAVEVTGADVAQEAVESFPIVVKNGEKIQSYFKNLQAAFDAVQEGETIVLVNDITATETVVANATATLDLNGFTVSMEDASSATAALIKNNGNLTIVDGSEAKAGKLYFKSITPSATNAYASNVISNYGTITINGGTIENATVGGACYALDNYAGSTATIEGGKLIAANTAVRIYNWTDGEAAKATLNITGGEIVSEDGYGVNVNSGNTPYVALNISGGTITTNDTDYNLAVYVINKGNAANFTANVTGGTLNGNFALNGVTSTTMAEDAVSVSDGTLEGVICYADPAYGFVSGGTFSSAVNEAYCAAGYIPTVNVDGTYGVKSGVYVARIDGVGYESLQEAYDAVADGGTITLDTDATGAGLVVKKNVTIDFNGKTYTVNDAVGSTGTATLAFQVLAGANATPYNVTFKNGKIAVTNDVVAGSKKLKVVVMNYSNLTLDGMTIDGTGSDEMIYGVVANNGELTLAGETTITVAEGDCALDIDGSQKYYGAVTANIGEGVEINGDVDIYGEEASVEITGGTFKGDFSIKPEAYVLITGGAFYDNDDEDVLLHLAYGYQLTGSAAPYAVENTGTTDLVKIEDNGNCTEFYVDKKYEVVELVYTRTLKATNTWYPLYVPFQIPVTDELLQDYDVTYINDVHSYDEDNNGEIDKMQMEVLNIAAGNTLKANYPYLFRAKNEDAKNMELVLENTTLYPTEENSIECSSVFMKFKVTGIYEEKTFGELGKLDEVMGMSGGSWKYATDESVTLPAFRLYLTVTSLDGSPVAVDPAALAKIRICLRGEEGDATGIISPATMESAAGAAIYDLMGRQVVAPEKGRIYIMNGKKVIFK